MIFNMKRTLSILLTMILTQMSSFSENISTITETDSIVYITAQDLKYANLIFVEHDKLLNNNNLLNQQIENYKNLNLQLEEVDSLRLLQINEYDKINKDYLVQINNLNTEVKKKNSQLKNWQIGGISVTIGLILVLLLK